MLAKGPAAFDVERVWLSAATRLGFYLFRPGRRFVGRRALSK
jgi:hypothetical protein